MIGLKSHGLLMTNNSLIPGVSCETPEVRSQFNTLVFEFWLKNNSEPRLQLKEKVYLESHTGRKS